MKIVIAFIMVLLFTVCPNYLCGQVLISDSNTTTDPTAMLEIRSTSKGLLPPRMTEAEREAILNPTPGLIIYCIDCLELQMFNDTAWTNMIGLPTSIGFQCGDSLSYEGQNYSTILIGSQCWFTENLNVGVMINGNTDQINNLIVEKYCYNDNPINCDIYGGLYQWDEIMHYSNIESIKGICPVGWHVPSNSEFLTLTSTISGSNIASKMAGNETLWTDGTLDQSPDFGTSGLNVLPSGFRKENTTFSAISILGLIWSSTEINDEAWSRGINFTSTSVFVETNEKPKGFNVRCVKN